MNVVSFGGGTNSTAMIIGMYLHKIPTKLARQVEIGKRQDAENILYRLRLIETCINKTDKRTLRIWKQLQQLLHLESEETE